MSTFTPSSIALDRRHLISLADMSSDDVRMVIDRARLYSDNANVSDLPLVGAVVGLYFRKTSTRTRTAFSAGSLRLGANIVSYGPDDLQENTGETFADTGRVLSGMLDGFVARTAGSPQELAGIADQRSMSVINAMTADEHPTQAFADLCTLLQVYGRLDGLRMLYVGEGNNTASALALAFAHIPGAALYLRTPPGYGVLAEKLDRAKGLAALNGAIVQEAHDMSELPADLHAVYTTRWQTTGTTKTDPQWRSVFEPFRVDARLMARFPEAVFLHDLPAHRGDEVEADVLEGPASVAFRQAFNKCSSAMAVLEWCIKT